jgi:hypothetical protein
MTRKSFFTLGAFVANVLLTIRNTRLGANHVFKSSVSLGALLVSNDIDGASILFFTGLLRTNSDMVRRRCAAEQTKTRSKRFANRPLQWLAPYLAVPKREASQQCQLNNR